MKRKYIKPLADFCVVEEEEMIASSPGHGSNIGDNPSGKPGGSRAKSSIFDNDEENDEDMGTYTNDVIADW